MNHLNTLMKRILKDGIPSGSRTPVTVKGQLYKPLDRRTLDIEELGSSSSLTFLNPNQSIVDTHRKYLRMGR
ncbi:hypothetical protein O9992_08315 [Vibrio lentus]|nr:hypothetical protein [Vibrio lentus]